MKSIAEILNLPADIPTEDLPVLREHAESWEKRELRRMCERIAAEINFREKCGLTTVLDDLTSRHRTKEDIAKAVKQGFLALFDGLYFGAWARSPVKPHHVHPKRESEGCKLCAQGIDHLRYLGVSRRTGFRHWAGSGVLVQTAAVAARRARCRANGSQYWLLTIEG